LAALPVMVFNDMVLLEPYIPPPVPNLGPETELLLIEFSDTVLNTA
jgi:hypothetical protein